MVLTPFLDKSLSAVPLLLLLLPAAAWAERKAMGGDGDVAEEEGVAINELDDHAYAFDLDVQRGDEQKTESKAGAR